LQIGILVFIKVDGTSFTEMFAANDWKPFQSCFAYDRDRILNIKNPQKVIYSLWTTLLRFGHFPSIIWLFFFC
jgi:hypothetical protein